MKVDDATTPIDQDNFERKANGNLRPFQWIDIKFHDGSIAQFSIPMLIDFSGYTTTVNFALNIRSVKTSLNQHALIESTSIAFNGILPTIIDWNSKREWIFTLNADKPKIYLLKEHTELLADLGKDFSFGPIVPLDYFIPITYVFKGTLLNYQGYFCTNQFNVILVHNDLDENCILLSLLIHAQAILHCLEVN